MKKAVSITFAMMLFIAGMNASAHNIELSPIDPVDSSNLVTSPLPEDPNGTGDPRDPEGPVNLEEIPLAKIHDAVLKMSIYPNPSPYGDITIDIPVDEQEQIGLVVYNSSGAEVLRKSGTYAEIRNLVFTDTSDAVYILKAFTKDQLFQARLMLVHR